MGKCKTYASTQAPRHLGVSEKKKILRRVEYHSLSRFFQHICFTHTVCYYSTSACERIDHVRMREQNDMRIERDLSVIGWLPPC